MLVKYVSDCPLINSERSVELVRWTVVGGDWEDLPHLQPLLRKHSGWGHC